MPFLKLEKLLPACRIRRLLWIPVERTQIESIAGSEILIDGMRPKEWWGACGDRQEPPVEPL